MGITMGKAVYHKEFKKEPEPAVVLTDAFSKAPNLDLLVSILPGKTPFYGKYSYFSLFCHKQLTSFKMFNKLVFDVCFIMLCNQPPVTSSCYLMYLLVLHLRCVINPI